VATQVLEHLKGAVNGLVRGAAGNVHGASMPFR
jgi:hypothetical protein